MAEVRISYRLSPCLSRMARGGLHLSHRRSIILYLAQPRKSTCRLCWRRCHRLDGEQLLPHHSDAPSPRRCLRKTRASKATYLPHLLRRRKVPCACLSTIYSSLLFVRTHTKTKPINSRAYDFYVPCSLFFLIAHHHTKKLLLFYTILTLLKDELSNYPAQPQETLMVRSVHTLALQGLVG